MAVLAHSEIRAMIHACVQAKNLNMGKRFVTRRLYRTTIHAAHRRWGVGESLFAIRWIGRDALPTSRSMAHLGTGSVVSLRDEREANG